MPLIPRDQRFDSTLAMLREPYEFVSKTCRRFGTDLFEARLLLRKTVCMTGPKAAELFYDEERFTRRAAAPGRIQKTLFGRGGVQGLDGEAHRHRKRMFMSLVTPERISHLGQLSADLWHVYAHKWAAMERVTLYSEIRELLTQAVCAWAGVAVPEYDVTWRTAQLTAMFDYAGSFGPKHWWSRLARKGAERWTQDLIEEIRGGRLHPPEDSAAYVIATHRELNGNLLAPRIAAVELLNVLRPTVAVSVFIVLAAHALHEHPECRQKLQSDGADYAEMFAQEVRRFYPFFPAVGAIVRRDFEWKGYNFHQGVRALLDLYGTNHDPRAWVAPNEFQPERFRTWDRSLFNFIPQGGGDYFVNHRCPGDEISVELIKVAAKFLAGKITYDVPEQELQIDYARLPALPQSRFIIGNVRELEGETSGIQNGVPGGSRSVINR